MYEAVLRDGSQQDVLDYIDGVLLVDLWSELVLPRDVRTAWSPLIDRVLAASCTESDAASDISVSTGR